MALPLSSPFVLLVIWISLITTGSTDVPWHMVTAPWTEALAAALTPEKAKICPNSRTSSQVPQAMRRPSFCDLPSLRALKMSFLAARRSARELYPSTQRLSDWTNTGRPMWMNRLRIFRRIHSPVTSPYPLSLVLGRFPSSGSPFGFALSTLNTMMKSCLFINLSHFLPDRIIILYKI